MLADVDLQGSDCFVWHGHGSDGLSDLLSKYLRPLLRLCCIMGHSEGEGEL